MTGDNAPWLGESSAAASDGVDAASSGSIDHGQASRLETTIAGPGTLTFYSKVSSELNHDYLQFIADGVPQTYWSGEVAWTQQTYNVTEGIHRLA